MAEKLEADDIKEFEFYWTPRKETYDNDKIGEFQESEYTFVFSKGDVTNSNIDKSFTSDDGVVFMANSKELKDVGLQQGYFSYDTGSFRDIFKTNYFFNVGKDEVHSLFKRAMIVCIFDEETLYSKQLLQIET